MEARHFESISIKGYRRLRDVQLETRNLAVLIGANGCGKTSFLDVWSTLAAASSGQLASKISTMGGISDVVTLGKDDAFSVGITMQVPGYAPLEYEVEIGVQRGQLYRINRESLTQRKQVSRPPFKHIEAMGLDVRYFRGKNLLRPNWEYDPLETALSQIPKMFQDPEALRKQLASCTYYGPLDVSPRSQVRLPAKMQPATLPGSQGEDLVSSLYYLRETDHDSYDVLEDTLKAAFPDFERLDFPPVAAGLLTMTWKDRNFSKPMYLHQLSEGTLRFIWLATLLLNRNLTAITLVDEPEVSLHPELLRLLADLMRDAAQRTLLIVATHSDRLIRFLKPVEVIVADVEEGETRLTWADTLDLESWLADYSLDEIWQMGKLGGRS